VQTVEYVRTRRALSKLRNITRLPSRLQHKTPSPRTMRQSSIALGLTLAIVLMMAGTKMASAQQSATASPSNSPSVPSPTPGVTAEHTQPGQGGAATHGTFAPVLDSEKRPITKGGFVKGGPVIFMDVAEKAGLTSWHNTMGSPQKNYILETNGSGVALLDYDNDGWVDIYLVNGSTLEAFDGKAPAPRAALFHNNHDGTFTNVADKAGVTNDRWGFGVAIGDYDNDGWPDIYVGNYGKNRLFHNNHDGTFTDVAEKAGVTVGNWSTGASFGDYDGDGKLDLFVPGYIHWDMADLPPAPIAAGAGFSVCQFRGVSVMCGPRGLKGEPDHLFHNNGDGTFTDVSEKAGVSDPDRHYGFTSTFVDVNNDGKVDLLVANDSTANFIYINKGDGTFEDASFYSGFALNQDGQEQASMGLAVGDYRNNGLVDLYTGTFSDDYKSLFRNDGKGNFREITPEMGMAEVTYPFLTWSTEFIDYDNDGWKDIFAVNGHVYPQADLYNWGTSFAQRPYLFHNMKGQKFSIVPPAEGTGMAEVVPGRGAGFGDLFNNGKISVVINCIDHVPALMNNVDANKNHWVGLKLTGGAKSPRDAIGATAYLTADGTRLREDVMSGGSYESSNDQRLHFGLGTATTVSKLEIHWPSGFVEQVTLPGVDRIYVIEEGKGVVPSVYDSMAWNHAGQSATAVAAK
jgi:enediyne biosynthesis protein E4